MEQDYDRNTPGDKDQQRDGKLNSSRPHVG